IKICFPPMPGQVNCMHSKLMLLFYDDYMRIVIPSANLTKYDWGEDGRMENSVFIIDLPGPLAASGEKSQSVDDLPPFGQELHYFLRRMEVPESLETAILRYDFSPTAHLAFIHTVGGSHFGEDMERTGYPGLSRAVRQLDLETTLPMQIDFAASSLGSLNEAFLKTMYDAVSGIGPSLNAAANGKIAKGQQLRDSFRIYFPTHETVANSFGGTDAAGTICLRRQWFTAPTFPKALMRDYRSSRPGLLSHNKIL
ncbi:phospholipase D/nuclease, partial [Rhizodiscina lignyota]